MYTYSSPHCSHSATMIRSGAGSGCRIRVVLFMLALRGQPLLPRFCLRGGHWRIGINKFTDDRAGSFTLGLQKFESFQPFFSFGESPFNVLILLVCHLISFPQLAELSDIVPTGQACEPLRVMAWSLSISLTIHFVEARTG